MSSYNQRTNLKKPDYPFLDSTKPVQQLKVSLFLNRVPIASSRYFTHPMK